MRSLIRHNATMTNPPGKRARILRHKAKLVAAEQARQRENMVRRRAGSIPLEEAAAHILIQGPFAGRSIGEAGRTEAGLLELEREAGEERLGVIDPLDRLYLEAYVTDWKISRDLEAIKDRARVKAEGDAIQVAAHAGQVMTPGACGRVKPRRIRHVPVRARA